MVEKLRDRKAVLAIAARLDRVKLGNFGDVEPVSDGVSEMRIFLGPGYRLYYTIRNNKVFSFSAAAINHPRKRTSKRAKKIAKTI